MSDISEKTVAIRHYNQDGRISEDDADSSSFTVRFLVR